METASLVSSHGSIDFGYWDRDGMYHPPCQDWRRDRLDLIMQEAQVPTVSRQDLIIKASWSFLTNPLPDNYANLSMPALWAIIDESALALYEFTDVATIWELIKTEAGSWGEFLKEIGVQVK